MRQGTVTLRYYTTTKQPRRISQQVATAMIWTPGQMISLRQQAYICRFNRSEIYVCSENLATNCSKLVFPVIHFLPYATSAVFITGHAFDGGSRDWLGRTKSSPASNRFISRQSVPWVILILYLGFYYLTLSTRRQDSQIFLFWSIPLPLVYSPCTLLLLMSSNAMLRMDRPVTGRTKV